MKEKTDVLYSCPAQSRTAITQCSRRPYGIEKPVGFKNLRFFITNRRFVNLELSKIEDFCMPKSEILSTLIRDNPVQRKAGLRNRSVAVGYTRLKNICF